MARRPRIVFQIKLDAFGDRWMVVKPKDHKRRWIGFLQINFTQNLIALRRYLGRIGHNAVRNFESEYIGLMLDVAPDRAVERRGKKEQERSAAPGRRHRA